MSWLADYWWLIPIFLLGVIINAITDLCRVNHKKYLINKPTLPPHRDNNAQWDESEDDYPKKK